MSIMDVLTPKSLSTIRKEVPVRFSHAMVGDQLYNLNQGKKYITISNIGDNNSPVSDQELFNEIVSSYRGGDEVLLEHEIYFGEFNYHDYIVLNELFTPIQKWDLLLCMGLFNGEETRFELRLANQTKQRFYWFSTNNLSYKKKLLKIIEDLELVKLHITFEAMGGSHEIPSRFTDLVQRAGWDNGIKMIKAILRVLGKLQDANLISKNNIMTRISDRLQSDDHDIIYRFAPGDLGYQLFTRHLFIEDTTSVRIIKDGVDVWQEEIFEWGI
jgi:hypothetical protein